MRHHKHPTHEIYPMELTSPDGKPVKGIFIPDEGYEGIISDGNYKGGVLCDMASIRHEQNRLLREELDRMNMKRLQNETS